MFDYRLKLNYSLIRNSYKRMETKHFPRWEMLVAIIVEWVIITLCLTRGLTTLVKVELFKNTTNKKKQLISCLQLHNFGFIFKMIVFTVLLITVLTKKGCGEGIHRVFYVQLDNITLNQASFYFLFFVINNLSAGLRNAGFCYVSIWFDISCRVHDILVMFAPKKNHAGWKRNHMHVWSVNDNILSYDCVWYNGSSWS